MIENKFDEAFTSEWMKANITNPANELVILRKIIPWQKIWESGGAGGSEKLSGFRSLAKS